MTTIKREELSVSEIYDIMKKDLRDWSKKKDVKLSVTKNNFNDFCVAIMSSKECLAIVDYDQLNPNYLEDSELLTEQGKIYALEIRSILRKNHQNDSDYHTDYHCVNFYYNIHIGKYNKPYIAECLQKDMSLDEALKMDMDLERLLMQNKQFSADNREAIENYLKLKTMFSV